MLTAIDTLDVNLNPSNYTTNLVNLLETKMPAMPAMLRVS